MLGNLPGSSNSIKGTILNAKSVRQYTHACEPADTSGTNVS